MWNYIKNGKKWHTIVIIARIRALLHAVHVCPPQGDSDSLRQEVGDFRKKSIESISSSLCFV